MTKYVELNAVLDAIGNQQDGTGITFEALSHAMRDVMSLPQVDAVPVKHGSWVGNERHTSCSICGQTYCVPDGQDGCLDMTFYKYCPNCGARMDVE